MILKGCLKSMISNLIKHIIKANQSLVAISYGNSIYRYLILYLYLSRYYSCIETTFYIHLQLNLHHIIYIFFKLFAIYSLLDFAS